MGNACFIHFGKHGFIVGIAGHQAGGQFKVQLGRQLVGTVDVEGDLCLEIGLIGRPHAAIDNHEILRVFF